MTCETSHGAVVERDAHPVSGASETTAAALAARLSVSPVTAGVRHARRSMPHQSMVHCIEQAQAAVGRAQRAYVMEMFLGDLVKLIARDVDDEVVCYAEVNRSDAAHLLAVMGFSTAGDVTGMVETFVADGMSFTDAADAAGLIVRPNQ